MDWIRLSLRRLRDERIGTLGLVGLVLVTALAFGLAPRVLQQVSDGSLRSEVTSAASAERNLQLTRLIRFDEEVPTRVTDIPVGGEELEDAFPDVISDAIAERTWVVETPSWQVASGVPIATVVNLRIQEGAAERVRLVEGVLPTGRVGSVVDDRPGVPPGSALVLVEAMMSSSAADKIGLVVGSTLLLGPDPLDPLSAGLSIGAAIKVVGTYELEDPADPFWLEDAAVAGWRIRPLSPNVEFVSTTVLLAPEVYGSFLSHTHSQGLPTRYMWRYFVDPARLEAGSWTST